MAPATVEADKFKVTPSHNGELLDTVGDEGVGLIVTFAVATLLAQPFTVAVTE